MGGLWVDYDLMSTIPGLFVLGEANFSITAPTVRRERPRRPRTVISIAPYTVATISRRDAAAGVTEHDAFQSAAQPRKIGSTGCSGERAHDA